MVRRKKSPNPRDPVQAKIVEGVPRWSGRHIESGTEVADMVDVVGLSLEGGIGEGNLSVLVKEEVVFVEAESVLERYVAWELI